MLYLDTHTSHTHIYTYGRVPVHYIEHPYTLTTLMVSLFARTRCNIAILSVSMFSYFNKPEIYDEPDIQMTDM